jgi:hypothetical protein
MVEATRHRPPDIDLAPYLAFMERCWKESVALAKGQVARDDGSPDFDENEYRRHVFELAMLFFDKIIARVPGAGGEGHG